MTVAAKKFKPLDVFSVSKKFGQKTVLHDVSISIDEGEIFGLVGINGIGKTTLIKIILDLLRQDSGQVKFFGQNAQSTASRKNISYLPEKFYPSLFLKGREFLSLSLSFYGKKLSNMKMLEKAEILQLDTAMLDQKISKYSKGMGQKLGLLSSFLTEAPLLILDEPMSGLDPSARIQLKNLIRDYKKQGKTIFFTSHILADIEEICDRMAVIHNGRIIYEGTPENLLKKYSQNNLEKAFLSAITA